VEVAQDEMGDVVLASARALLAMAIRTVADGPVPLTVVQHRVLLLLEGAGRLTVTEVAERLGVDQSNASRHCSRLTELGLVARGPSALDRRATYLRLTRTGREQVQSVRAARRRWADSVLARLSDEQAREAAHGLAVFAAAAEALDGAEGSPLL